MLSGGFNVNSTSVDAWKAVLAAMDEAAIDTVLGVDPASTGRYAMLRVRRPAEKNIDGDPLPIRLYQDIPPWREEPLPVGAAGGGRKKP